MIRDKNIDWLRKTRFVPAGEMLSGSMVDVSGAISGMGTGAPPLTEVSTFGFGALIVDASDVFSFLDWDTPREMDVTKDIGVRVHYCTIGTTAATDDVLFTMQYQQVDVGAALAAATVALDTPITVHRNGVTTTLITHRTPRGIISASKFDDTAKQGLLHWELTATTVDYSSGELGLLGVEIDYVPRLCRVTAEGQGVLNSDLAAA